MSLMGVVIVTYNSRDEILPCLESLLATDGSARLRIVIVDNASSDDTVARVREWSDGSVAASVPEARLAKPLTLLPQGKNLGFAAGVNVGLRVLQRDPEISRFWLLNPDTIVPAATPAKLMAEPDGFALMGNRICYSDPDEIIQIDAGQIDTRFGVTSNINLGERASITPTPVPAEIDFISGASLIASRDFVETAGLMPETYFLYYEEVDWALRRGDLPLVFCADAPIYHVAGASIGSPSLDRAASHFSLYHKHRSRLIFLRRWHPRSVFWGLAYGCAKALQLAVIQGWQAGWAVLAGQFGWQYPFEANRYAINEASSDRSVS